MSERAEPHVTVFMPVYNGAEYIGQAIRSVLDQSFTDFELLVVNDGSTDGTDKVVRSFTDPRVRFVDMERNRGVVAVSNDGFDLARGAYLARMDSDDLMLPDRLALQSAYLDAHPETAICGGAVEMFGGADSHVARYPESDADIRCEMLWKSPFSHPTIMVRMDKVRALGLRYDPEAKYAEDYDFFERLGSDSRMANLPDVLVRYRTHDGQVTNRHGEVMRSVAAAIRRRQLQRVIPDLGEREAALHETAVDFGRLVEGRELPELEAWMLRLTDRAVESGLYEEGAMRNFMAARWLNLCLRASGAGPAVLWRYLRSPLRVPRRGAMRREFRLAAKCLASLGSGKNRNQRRAAADRAKG